MLSLTFNSHKAYQYALQTWGFINDKADDRFLLIANHEGCGPDEKRQAYMCVGNSLPKMSLNKHLFAESPQSRKTFRPSLHT